jgi:hypothetical protein
MALLCWYSLLLEWKSITVPLWLGYDPAEAETTMKQTGCLFTMLGLTVTVFTFVAIDLRGSP